MKLEEFKALDIQEDNIIEFCLTEKGVATGIRLGYFGCFIESYPEEKPGYGLAKLTDKEPPYIGVAREKERHGCPSAFEYHRIEDIRWLYNHGKSAASKLHWHS